MMKHGAPNRRNRGRSGPRRNTQQRAQVYDSNGPDVRIRGTAHQVAEKYLALAKDAASAGDPIIAENYYQHAEHYIRIINDSNGKFAPQKAPAAQSAEQQETEGNAQGTVSKASEDEDLSLPKSILGPEIRCKEQEEEIAEI